MVAITRPKMACPLKSAIYYFNIYYVNLYLGNTCLLFQKWNLLLNCLKDFREDFITGFLRWTKLLWNEHENGIHTNQDD